MKKIVDFLKRNNNYVDSIDYSLFKKNLLNEIDNSLNNDGVLPMIPSFLPINIKREINRNVLLLDLGGTNLRVAKGYYDDSFTPHIEVVLKEEMIGLKEEVSKEVFFNTLYKYIEPYLDDVSNIGLCFSYNTTINRSLEGVLNSWSKEVKAKEVIGLNINKELKNVIKKNTNKDIDIVLLNDTCSCLLGSIDKEYSSYLGLIFGTGFNIAYLERKDKLVKIDDPFDMIINSESAEFNNFTIGTFDERVIRKSEDPNSSILEKVTSGRYLKDLINEIIESLYKENIIENIKLFNSLEEASNYSINNNDEFTFVINEVVKRSAKLIATTTSAFIDKCYKINNKKVMLAIEGTTFYKLHNFKEFYISYLNELTNDYELVDGRDKNLNGALYASFIK